MNVQPVSGDSSQLAESDFELIDLILDATETAMLDVASEHHLREVKLERWRWDQPQIFMSWTPFRQLPSAGKNIRALVRPLGKDLFDCSFESNAWYDEHETPDSYTRYWAHFPVGSVSIANPKQTLPSTSPAIRAHLEFAYERASDSGKILLDRAIRIATNGEAQNVSGSVVLGKDMIEHRTPAAD